MQAVLRRADERDVDVVEMLTARPSGEASGGPPAGGLVLVWERTQGELERARRRPMWPAPTLPAATADRLLLTAGLDPHEILAERTPTGRVRDLLAKALRHQDACVDVRLPGLDLTFSAPKSVSLLWALSDDAPPAAGGVAAELPRECRQRLSARIGAGPPDGSKREQAVQPRSGESQLPAASRSVQTRPILGP